MSKSDNNVKCVRYLLKEKQCDDFLSLIGNYHKPLSGILFEMFSIRDTVLNSKESFKNFLNQEDGGILGS